MFHGKSPSLKYQILPETNLPSGSNLPGPINTLNRLTTLANSWAGSFGFSYDALSRRTQMTRPNSVTTNYAYDNLSRLTGALHQLSGNTIDGAAYTLDSAGNRTAKTDELASVTSNYGYDAIYELTGVTQGTTTTESYSCDPAANRLTSLGVSSYTNNTSNELTATSNASYTYDYNGNRTSQTVSSNTTSYSWDYENRLASVTLPSSGGTVAFKYDPFGRRIQKVFTQGSTTTTTNYLYDGNNDIEEVNSSGSLVARYAQTLDIDEPLAESRSSTTSYYETDGLGSVTSLSTTAGALTNTYTFDSFGNQTGSTRSVANFFRYTAREFDSETGLYFYRARYYDSAAGRFLGEDRIRSRNGYNFYAYVWNHPTDEIDPSGMWPGFGKIWKWGKGAWDTGTAIANKITCDFYCFECGGSGVRQALDKAQGNGQGYSDSIINQQQQMGTSDPEVNQYRMCTHDDPNCTKCLECLAEQGVTKP